MGTAISDFCIRKQHLENQKSTGLESCFESSEKIEIISFPFSETEISNYFILKM